MLRFVAVLLTWPSSPQHADFKTVTKTREVANKKSYSYLEIIFKKFLANIFFQVHLFPTISKD
jgi:hypothetical protein